MTIKRIRESTESPIENNKRRRSISSESLNDELDEYNKKRY